jgi:predicted TIM-barrel fold metal-dependent hydrolase
VLDCSVLVGSGPRLVPAAAYSMEAAVRELSGHGIAGALVASRAGASYDQSASNDDVLAVAGIAAGVRLYPVATLNPVQYLDWPAELSRVLAAGAVALRFHPDVQHWPVTSAAFADMVRAVRGRCPLLLPVSQFGDASAIGAATAGAGAPVVLLGGHYTQLGDCLAALKRWPHLYLETSRLAQFRGIATVVREVGAARLLFGSGTPARPVQAVLNAILDADIAESDKRAILADNAARILQLPAQPFAVPAPGRAIGLVDVHQHVGTLGLPTPPPPPSLGAAQPGIAVAVASSLRAIAGDLTRGNAEALADLSAPGPTDRYAYVVLDPNDLAASCQALAEAYRHDRVVGAKVHCGWSGQPTSGRACGELLRSVAAAGRPLKIHVDGPDWEVALSAVASDFPKWPVIVAHGGPGSPTRAAAELVQRTTNVYVELATSFPDLPAVRDVVRRVGPDRLLFGSDAPLLDPAYALGLYTDAGADLPATTAVARQVFGW